MSPATTALTPAPGMSDKKPALWAGLTSFFLMWSFLYIVLIVFRPSWVCLGTEVLVVDPLLKNRPAVDEGRAFVVALIITLIVMLIVWLVAATAASKA